MRLPNDEWLHLAKGTPIGGQRRVRHKHERTDALTVGNREDRWWAYCQRCKAGAVEMKSHVLLGSVAPAESVALSLPSDGTAIHALPLYEQQNIASFLASKGMDLTYFEQTPVTWSRSRMRLLVHTPSGLMGRDTTGRSEQKWLTYERQHWIKDPRTFEWADVVLVEDCFSWAKIAHACKTQPVSVYCTLGTAIHDSLFLHLMHTAKRVYSFYDGDAAGWAGAVRNEQRLYAIGLSPGRATQFQMCAPRGMDPKDMDCAALDQHVRSLFTIS